MIELKKSPVEFHSEDHTYRLGDKELKGITSTLVHRAYPNTYARPAMYTEEEWQNVLAEAAAKGSNMHETIELFDELGVVGNLPELQSYIRIKEQEQLTVLATEYVVSDEKHYATAIDKVMQKPDGGIILVDFKRTSVKHYENVALQLSICKRFFEMQNPELKVSECYLMWLRDDKSEFTPLSVWSEEALDSLIEADLKNEDFDIEKVYGSLPVEFAKVEDEIVILEAQVKAMQARQAELKDGLYSLMEKYNIKSWTGSKVKITRKLPSVQQKFDSAKLKEDDPKLYEKYVKQSKIKGGILITVQK